MRSLGKRNLLVGVILLAFGIALLSLSTLGSDVIIIPGGALVAGVIEIVRGLVWLA
jgi:hypothetical protein